MTDKTATGRLRELLDGAGVEWWNDTDPEPQHETVVHDEDRIVIFHENANGTVGYHVHNVHDLTPEQAIAATVGSGTCKNLASHQGCAEFVCSGCGTHYVGFRFNFCPNCGARVMPDGR